MVDQVEPADAARALSEIGRRREQVIRRAVIPGWFWWAIAVLMITFTAAIESRRGLLLGIGITLFVAGTLVITGRVVFRLVHDAPPHRGLAGPKPGLEMLVGIATFVAVIVGASLAIGFSLKAARVPYPGTVTVAATAVLFVVGGPMLMRYQTRILVRRSRSHG